MLGCARSAHPWVPCPIIQLLPPHPWLQVAAIFVGAIALSTAPYLGFAVASMNRFGRLTKKVGQAAPAPQAPYPTPTACCFTPPALAAD